MAGMRVSGGPPDGSSTSLPPAGPKPRAPRINVDPNRMRPYPLKHVQRGVETLAELDQRGFLTNSQVADLLFADRPNPQGEPRTDTAAQAAANRTLRRLWHSGLVERSRVVLTSRRTNGPYVAFVNVLTTEGAQAC